MINGLVKAVRRMVAYSLFLCVLQGAFAFRSNQYCIFEKLRCDICRKAQLFLAFSDYFRVAER